MFLKNRLKKELTNLKIWKNSKVLHRIILPITVILGLYTIAGCGMPESSFLFSGTSVLRSSMEKINNYSNVIDYKYHTTRLQINDKRLKDIGFTFDEKIEIPKDMCPQGICFTDKYVFVTFYTAETDGLGNIMIFEKESGKYLLSLGMDENSHLGGIAYDGANIWVCNSSKMSIERISYDFICRSIEKHEGDFLDVRNIAKGYRVSIIPSCITFFDDRLWLAAHTKQTNSQMISYIFCEEKDALSFDELYFIPSKVQGIVFDPDGRVYLSTSYGRRKSSYLKIYDSVGEMSKNVDNYITAIEMPPCSEGIDIHDGSLYIIFESGSEKYLEGTDGKGKCLAPLDKILIIDLAWT